MTIREVINVITSRKSEGYNMEQIKNELLLIHKVEWSPLLDDIVHKIKNNCLNVNEEDLDKEVSTSILSDNERQDNNATNTNVFNTGQNINIPNHLVYADYFNGERLIKNIVRFIIIAICVAAFHFCIGR